MGVARLQIGENPFGSNAVFRGEGAVIISGELINNGKIIAGSVFGEGVLSIVTSGDGTLDLDGNTTGGILQVTGGDLKIDAPLCDPFGGTAIIGGGRTMTFFKPWEMFGTLTMNGQLDSNQGQPWQASKPRSAAPSSLTVRGIVSKRQRFSKRGLTSASPTSDMS